MKALHSLILTNNIDWSGWYFPNWPARARSHHYYIVRYRPEEINSSLYNRAGPMGTNGIPNEIRISGRFFTALCGRTDRQLQNTAYYSWYSTCRRCASAARRHGFRDRIYTSDDPHP